MIVTIDGPAGAGKSSASRALARRLQYAFLDTGAMYRAVAWAALERKLDWNDDAAIARLARQIQIELDDERVRVDGQDISDAIRSLEITSVTRYAADNPAVREHLVKLQREFAQDKANIVTEGRDQGTIVFPLAACKIFLTASPTERARRRADELRRQGQEIPLEEILASQEERDSRDATREVGGLRAAADAIHFSTDGLTAEEVVDRLEELVHRCAAESNTR